MATPETPQEHLFEHDTGPNLRLFGHGAIGGLVGGAVFAIAQMVYFAIATSDAWIPWKLFASLLGGAPVEGARVTADVFALGFLVHFVLSAAYGLVFGMVAQIAPNGIRKNWALHGAIGMALGFLIYLLDYHVFARASYPWFLRLNQPVQIVMHVVMYGLVVSLYLTAAARQIIAPRMHHAARVRRTA